MKKLNRPLLFIVIILTVLMSAVTVRSGWSDNEGVVFFGVNANDGIWHLSLISELKNHFPPQHPNFSGIELRGYHYLLDLLLAKFSLVFGFNEADLYFRFFPVLTVSLWCLATFLLASKYFKEKVASYLAVFFSVLGGSFSHLLLLFHKDGINFDSTFGVSSPISSLINLQFALSIPILALTVYAFANFLKKENLSWGLIAAIFSGFLVGLKIYAGMIALFAIGLSSIAYLIKIKRIASLWVVILGGFLGALVYLPISIGGAGLVFAPGEMVQSIIRGPLSWTLWEIERQIYAQHNNFLGLFRLGVLAILVFIFGNLGTKILGFGEFLRFRRSHILTRDHNLFLFTLIYPFLIPLLFIQSTTAFNIIQFWWYFLYFMSFLAAGFLWSILKEKTWVVKIISLVTIFFLTIPAAASVLDGYLFPKSSYNLSAQKVSALEFLKKNTTSDDVILEIPSISADGGFNFGLPLIPAFSQRRLFLGREMIEFPYLDKKRREKELEKIISPLKCKPSNMYKNDSCQNERSLSYKTLVENKIDYIFSSQPLFWFEENSKISPLIYSQNEIFIYAVR